MYATVMLYGLPFQVCSNISIFCNFSRTLLCSYIIPYNSNVARTAIYGLSASIIATRIMN